MLANNQLKKYYPVLIGLILMVIIAFKFFWSMQLFKDFSAFSSATGDAFGAYLVKTTEILQGDWSQMRTHASGWPIILAPFFSWFKTAHNFEYLPLQAVFSVIFSLFSVPIVYLLARHFLKEWLALSAAAIYALSPYLIENSLMATTEPAFIFFSLLSFLFLMSSGANGNKWLLFLSFILAGIAFWMRANGLAYFIALIIIALFVYKIKIKNVISASLGFLILFLPWAIQRYLELGIVFNFGSVSRYWHNNFNTIWAENISKISFNQFIQSNGLSGLGNFIMLGLKKLLIHFKLLFFPFIILFSPLSLWFLIKKRSKKLISLVIFCLLAFIIVLPLYPAQGSPRHLYFLVPFLIIFALIGLNEILKIHKSNLAAFFIFLGIFLTSFIYTDIYFFQNKKNYDSEQELEMVAEGQYLASHLQGKFTSNLPMLEIFTSDVYYLKNSFNASLSNGQLTFSDLYADNLDEYLKEAKKFDFNLIYVSDKNSYSFLDDVYLNEKEYTGRLIKVYDSTDLGLKEVKGKVFKLRSE